MINLYKENELIISQNTKKQLIKLYFLVLVVFVIAMILITVFAQAETYIYNLIANIVLSVIFALFSIMFLGIKLKLTQKHIELAEKFTKSKSITAECLIQNQSQQTITLNGLEFNEMLIQMFLNEKEETRKVYYQGKKIECFDTKDKLLLKLRHNIIVGYEVINNG